MRMKRQSPLKKKSKRGFHGYPIATIMFYGPTAQRATKVAAGIIAYEGADAKPLMRWWSEEDRFALDYFDVQVADGTLLRLRFDWLRRSWQVDALYD